MAKSRVKSGGRLKADGECIEFPECTHVVGTSGGKLGSKKKGRIKKK